MIRSWQVAISMMASDVKNFTVVSYNMHGFYQGYPFIDDLINTSKPDVFLLQEHWLTPANLYLFDTNCVNYFSFGKSAMSKSVESGMLRGRPFGGVMTLIRNDLRSVTETVIADDRFVIIRIAKYIIINLYLPCDGTKDRYFICENVLHAIASWCDYHTDCEIILGGDFNSNLDKSKDNIAIMIGHFLHN